MNSISINNYYEKCRVEVMSGNDEKVSVLHIHDAGIFCFAMTPTQARAMAAALVLHADAVDLNIAESFAQEAVPA